jgi:large subunit ribosomal protein L4
MGSKKVVHWRGGGTAFGPRPRDYSYQMPVKARRVALRNALYTKFADGEVCIADGWPTERPNTKEAVAILSALELDRSVLVVTGDHDRNLYLSLRNVPQVDVSTFADLNALSVLTRRNLVLTSSAMAMLEAQMGGGAD